MAQTKYQYGTNPRKIEPDNIRKRKQPKNKNIKVVKDVPRQQIKVSKEEKRNQFKLTMTVIAIFALLLAISYRNSQINEKFSNVQTLKKQLSSIQKENEQLKVNIENSVNLSNIEKQAKERLGMQRLTNKQTVYVNLPKKDYVESATEKVIIQDKQNWFEKTINKIFNK